MRESSNRPAGFMKSFARQCFTGAVFVVCLLVGVREAPETLRLLDDVSNDCELIGSGQEASSRSTSRPDAVVGTSAANRSSLLAGNRRVNLRSCTTPPSKDPRSILLLLTLQRK